MVLCNMSMKPPNCVFFFIFTQGKNQCLLSFERIQQHEIHKKSCYFFHIFFTFIFLTKLESKYYVFFFYFCPLNPATTTIFLVNINNYKEIKTINNGILNHNKTSTSHPTHFSFFSRLSPRHAPPFTTSLFLFDNPARARAPRKMGLNFYRPASCRVYSSSSSSRETSGRRTRFALCSKRGGD